TTNSEIAVNNNGKIEIVKNVFGDEYTPSVFGIDKSKNKVVGKRAYERLYKDASEEEFKNNKAEVKRLMGTSEETFFERANLKMTPEEISGEIIKGLKEDILRKYPDFDTISAVITIPAAFSTLQSEATKRAGNIAGFEHAVLLQEPIAAAVAYGFGNSINENWLIYDLGGGTFDVALISSKEGVLSVLGHNGDNFLGGKNIDLEIVDKIIVPKVLEKYSLNNFSRSNEKYRSVFAKLKYIAETAKIYLSQYDKTSIEVDRIGNDDSGEEIYLSIDFSRKEFEKLIKPLIDRTIELSKATLKEAGIKTNSVKKIILVGGPTLIPYIKHRLEDDLKITVDSSVDPLTVVARGACVFAISQKIPKELLEKKKKKTKKGTQTLNIFHETLTSENEQTVTGVIEELKNADEEYYIQIQSDSGFYSGRKNKIKNGKFLENVAVEPNKTNLYWVYLFDKDGNSVPVDPDSFSITHGLSVSGAPLPHSIGIVIAKKDFKSGFALTELFEKVFEKGSVLPLKSKPEVFKTIRPLKKGDDDNLLWIRIGEGESDIPDRNTFICELGIKGSDLPYDLPEGTDIEISLEVNESRELFLTAYIPLIDSTHNARATFRDEIVDVAELETELAAQEERARIVADYCSTDEKEAINETIQSAQSSVKNAHLDEDEKRKANKQIKDLKVVLDKVEKEKEMPQLIKEFHAGIENVQKIINEYADEKEKENNNEQLSNIKSEGEKAIAEKDKALLIRVNEQIQELSAKALFSNPATWVYQFQKLVSENHSFINEKEARYYTEKGHRAIELGDVDELKRCVHNLMLLLPSEEREAVRKNLSGITR
ncbi:MAG: Hsp70 family protein, partial [Candidatus Pacebacteria bacterium]|nr:Hsp70 family protein [Candidatus Paceibacterota bacterium]